AQGHRRLRAADRAARGQMEDEPEPAGGGSRGHGRGVAARGRGRGGRGGGDCGDGRAEGRYALWITRTESSDRTAERHRGTTMHRLLLIALVLLPLAGRPASALSYAPLMVLFDFDSAAINAAGQKVINWVLSEYSKHPDDYIAVTGYADRAGSEKYNMALSLRRANAWRPAPAAGGAPARMGTVAAPRERRRAGP